MTLLLTRCSTALLVFGIVGWSCVTQTTGLQPARAEAVYDDSISAPSVVPSSGENEQTAQLLNTAIGIVLTIEDETYRTEALAAVADTISAWGENGGDRQLGAVRLDRLLDVSPTLTMPQNIAKLQLSIASAYVGMDNYTIAATLLNNAVDIGLTLDYREQIRVLTYAAATYGRMGETQRGHETLAMVPNVTSIPPAFGKYELLGLMVLSEIELGQNDRAADILTDIIQSSLSLDSPSAWFSNADVIVHSLNLAGNLAADDALLDVLNAALTTTAKQTDQQADQQIEIQHQTQIWRAIATAAIDLKDGQNITSFFDALVDSVRRETAGEAFVFPEILINAATQYIELDSALNSTLNSTLNSKSNSILGTSPNLGSNYQARAAERLEEAIAVTMAITYEQYAGFYANSAEWVTESSRLPGYYRTQTGLLRSMVPLITDLDLSLALPLLASMEERVNVLADPLAKQEGLLITASAYKALGDYRGTDALLQQALALLPQMQEGELEQAKVSLGAIAHLYVDLQMPEQAIAATQQAIAIASAYTATIPANSIPPNSISTNQQSLALTHILQTYAELNHSFLELSHSQATALRETAMDDLAAIDEIIQAFPDESTKLTLMLSLAHTYGQLGDRQQMDALLNGVLDRVRGISMLFHRNRMSIGVAQEYWQIGDTQQAERVVAEAIATIPDSDNIPGQVMALSQLAETYQGWGQDGVAADLFIQAIRLSETDVATRRYHSLSRVASAIRASPLDFPLTLAVVEAMLPAIQTLEENYAGVKDAMDEEKVNLLKQMLGIMTL
ncbi:MAG: hypothetical protein AAGD25_33450 [Cyanobacteria bacterium P01_F01_bin.150]